MLVFSLFEEKKVFFGIDWNAMIAVPILWISNIKKPPPKSAVSNDDIVIVKCGLE
jgi:hypothetical protein